MLIIETLSWTKIETWGTLPQPRNSCSLSVIGDELFLFGGQTSNRRETNDFYSLDLQSMEWRELYRSTPDDNESESNDNATTHQDGNGEERETTHNNNTTPTTTTTDDTKKKKKKVRVMPQERADHTVATFGNKMYITCK